MQNFPAAEVPHFESKIRNERERACEQALLFGRVKRGSRERASERRRREGPAKTPSLARSREARFAFPNRRACSQATRGTSADPDAVSITHALPFP